VYGSLSTIPMNGGVFWSCLWVVFLCRCIWTLFVGGCSVLSMKTASLLRSILIVISVVETATLTVTATTRPLSTYCWTTSLTTTKSATRADIKYSSWTEQLRTQEYFKYVDPEDKRVGHLSNTSQIMRLTTVKLSLSHFKSDSLFILEKAWGGDL